MQVRTFRSVLKWVASLALLTACLAPISFAQQVTAAVPTLVNFSGTLADLNGKPLTTITGVTFLLYKAESGGAPLWMETQTVHPDKSGRYSVMLGSTRSEGLPTDVFVSGEARWMGVQPQDQAEQPRVLLLSVPYALKAGDAQTVGGLPASAFVLATGVNNGSALVASAASGSSAITASSGPPPASSNVTTTGGAVNAIPLFTTATNIQNSIVTQTGTAAVNVAGKLNHPATGTATAKAGKNSQPDDFVASVFNSSTSTAVPQTFQLQAEPAGNNTATASGTLNLLYASGTGAPAETGLRISNKGIFTFATGQTFPGTGTITGVMAGTGLTGGGSSGKVTLNLDTTKVPLLSAANTFAGAQTINNDVAISTSNGSNALTVTATGNNNGITATTSSVSGDAIQGLAMATTGSATGVYGSSSTPSGVGVYGLASAATTGTSGLGVVGGSDSDFGVGVLGGAVGNHAIGIYGHFGSASTNGQGHYEIGVMGDSSIGVGILGTSDSDIGVLGESTTDAGVWGVSNSNNGAAGQSISGNGVVATSGSGYGLLASSNNVGAYAIFSDPSTTGSGFSGVGVWGDSGVSGGFGTLATVDDGNALFGKNNTVNHETLYAENDSGFVNGNTPLAARFAGPGAATYCYIARDAADNGSGDLICTGSKSAAVPVDGNRMVRLYAVEAADNWFEDAGAGQLSNGSATVALDRVFAQTVNGELDYHVFLTPNGECEGLYVAHKTGQGFEIRELHGGHSNIAFDYRIMARRKGFEHVRMEDVSASFAQMKRESDLLAVRLEAGKAAEKAHPRTPPQMPHRKTPSTLRPANLLPTAVSDLASAATKSK